MVSKKRPKGQPHPEGPTSTPRRKGQPQPKGPTPNPKRKGQPQPEGPTPVFFCPHQHLLKKILILFVIIYYYHRKLANHKPKTEGPTPTRIGNPNSLQEKEGPTPIPSEGRANPTGRTNSKPEQVGPTQTEEGRANKTGRANPNTKKEGPTPTQERRRPTRNPNPQEGRANPDPKP